MKKIIPLMIIALCMFTACYEDKGNYDLIDVNEVTISGLNSPGSPYYHYAYWGENVHIEPEFSYSIPDDNSGFDYEWYVDTTLVSTERNLDYVPTGRTGYFTLTLKVRNQTTGRIDMNNTSLSVRSPYKVGFVMLTEKADGSTDMHYLRWDISNYVYETPVMYNVLSKANSGSMGKYPYKVVENLVNVNYGGDELLILQKEGEPFSVSGGSLERCVNLVDEFYGGFPEGAYPTDAVFGNMSDWLAFSNGKVYNRMNGDGAALRGFHLFHYLNVPAYFETKDETVSVERFFDTWFYNNNYMILGYDKGNNRLFGVSVGLFSGDASNGKFLNIMDNSSDPEAFANLNDMGDYELKWLQNTQSNTFKSILKKDGQYYLQSFNLSKAYYSVNATVSNQSKELFAGDVNDESLYGCTPNNNYLFYTKDNGFYYCELNNGQQVHKLHEFDRKINHMKLDFNGGHVLLTTEGGKIYFFNTNDQNLGAADPWAAGLEYESPDGQDNGEIKDVIFKWGDLNNFSGGGRGGSSNPF